MIFFFYGTLIAGGGTKAIRGVHARLHPLGPARMRGRLYAVPDRRGWYPALLPGAGVVRGMLYAATPRFSPRDLACLDAYEEFHPGQRQTSWYLRLAKPAEGSKAQVYLYNRPLPQGARRLADGDFHGWLTARGGRAFAG